MAELCAADAYDKVTDEGLCCDILNGAEVCVRKGLESTEVECSA